MKRQLLTFIVLAQLGGTLGACANIEVKTGCFQDADCFAGSVCIEGACVTPDEFECGNGRVEPGEICDGDCPENCNDGLRCTLDTMVGTLDECSAICVSTEIVACISDDGCCPDSCTAFQDSDCAECGNGQQEASEECDKGAANADGSDCTSECTLARCGDGFLYVGHEECDGGDADTAACDYDGGTGPQACTPPECGDGYPNAAAGEPCDGGKQDTATCNYAGGLAGIACTPVRCGDGHRNAVGGEACDDGEVDSEACDFAGGTGPQSCTVPSCGDGYLNTVAGEVCDDGARDTNTCNYAAGNGPAACMRPRCGDGHRNWSAGEECDDGETDSETCNYADGDPTLSCTWAQCGDSYTNVEAGELCDDGMNDTATCNYAAGRGAAACMPAICGDAHRNILAGEACDGGPQNTITCDYAGSTDPNSCTLAFCGDGHRNSARLEQCDNAADNSDTEPDACRENCQRARCGDGVIDSNEACDGNDVASGTCSGCELDCDEGYADCNGDPADGCECDSTSWNTIGFDGNKDVAVDSRGIVYTVDDFPSFGPIVHAYIPKIDWDERPQTRWTASFPDAVDVKLAVNANDVLIVAVTYDEGSWPSGRLIGYETTLSGPVPKTVLFDIDVAEETWPRGGVADIGANATSIFVIGDGTWFNGPDTEVSRYAWAGSGDPVLSSSWKASGGELWFVTANVGTDSIAIAGRFRGTTTFGVGQPNETTLVGGTTTIFVAKLSHSLQLQWVRQDEGHIIPQGMAVAPDGSIALTGSFSQVATFGEGETNERVIDGTSSFCGFAFLAKYNPSGQLDWVRVGGCTVETTRSSAGEGSGRAVHAVSDGSFVLVGWAKNLVLEPGVFVDGELFAAHYSEDGTVLSVSDPMWDEPPLPLYSGVRITQAGDGSILAAVEEIAVIVQFTVPGLTP